MHGELEVAAPGSLRFVYVRPRYRVRAAPVPASRRSAEPAERRRSHAAILPAAILLGLGLWLGTVTLLVPAVFGLVLVAGSLALLGSRLNPLSVGFYLTTKPSGIAIGTVFLSGVALLAMAYVYYVRAWGPLLPRLPGL